MTNTSFKHKALITSVILCIGYFLLFLKNGDAQSLCLKNDISKVSSTSLTELNSMKIWVDTFDCFRPIQTLPLSISSLPSDTKIGDNQYPYWLQFELKNSSTDTLKKWLHTSVFDSLTLFEINQDNIQVQERGLLIAYKYQQKQQFRSVWRDKYGFELTLPPHATTSYYLRIRNVIRAESSLASMTLESLPQRVESNGSRLTYFMLFSGAFFSVLFFLLLFSLVQFLQNRDKSYGFYSLYLLFCFLYYWWKFEKSNAFLNLIFTPFPDWYYYVEVPLWSAMYLTYMLFVMYFIDTKRYIPTFHQFLRIFIIGLSTYVFLDRIVIYLWDLSVAWDLFTIVRIMMFVISIAMIYFVFRAQQQLGFYVLWGSVLMLTGGFITMYLSNQMEIHYYGAWDVPLLPMQLGVIIEVFYFFVGLGYKSRLAEREKTIIYQDLKQEKEAAKKMKNRKEFLNHWYTNISHEFRTPLTVIGGMAEQIKGNAAQKNLILKNNKRLLHLVNQILDLSKMESNNLTIHWTQGDVIHFLNYLTSSFQSFAEHENILLSFHSEVETLWMDYDPEKLEQIIVNLLHNAIKFTPQYGTIKVHTKCVEKETQAFFKIIISDTGQGIDAEKLAHIFDRFYQADSGSTRKNEGTGIGLALTKELTKLLGGNITVSSELGKGTTFELLFPIHNTAKKENDLQALHVLPLLSTNEMPVSSTTKHVKKDLPMLLLVEDNQDVLHYLQSFLKHDYQLLMATNGKMGIDMATEHIPDMIISDVMMPEKDGFELCETLKKDRRTSHIPVILLTAKATIEDRISGLSFGADAYLAKPFNKKELFIRLQKLIENRQLLQQFYTQNKTQIKINSSTPQQEKEQIFLSQLHEVVILNLGNHGFDIPQLCLAMTMSKTQLHRKVKALTGKTAALYIRSIRLNKASKLLKETSLPIGEIAEQVGFNDLSYFSRVFKQEFGYSPSEKR